MYYFFNALKYLILVAALAYGIHYWYQHHQAKVALQNSADMLQELVEPYIPQKSFTATSTKEAGFFRMMYEVYEVDSNPNVDFNETLNLMCESLALEGNGEAVLKSAITENYERGKELGIFTDRENNLTKLQSGKAPTITLGGWSGTETSIALKVSPILAPEGINLISNFVLVPEAIEAMQNESVEHSVLSAAQESQRAKFLRDATVERIRHLNRTRY